MTRLFAAQSLAALPALALTRAPAYPDRSVHLVVGIPAGGGADVVARAAAAANGTMKLDYGVQRPQVLRTGKITPGD